MNAAPGSDGNAAIGAAGSFNRGSCVSEVWLVAGCACRAMLGVASWGQMEQRDQSHVLGARASYLAAHYLAKLTPRFRKTPKAPQERE